MTGQRLRASADVTSPAPSAARDEYRCTKLMQLHKRFPLPLPPPLTELKSLRNPSESRLRTAGCVNRARPLRLRRLDEADVDFTVDVGPLFGLSQALHELLEQVGVLGRVFEPSKKVEGLPELTRVMQPARDGG